MEELSDAATAMSHASRNDVCLYGMRRTNEEEGVWRRRVRRDPQTDLYHLEEQVEDDGAFKHVISFDNALSAIRSLMTFHPFNKSVTLYVNGTFIGMFHLDTWAADVIEHLVKC